MSQPNYRTAIVLKGDTPVDVVVIADGKAGDKTLAENPTWVEITGLDPMPGVDSGWKYKKGKWVPPPVPALTREQIETARLRAYAHMADPLFFQFQRGEVSQQVWLDAVQAVKDAHPYPER